MNLIQDDGRNDMANVTLYEYEPTRSLKCRWTLLEAGLDYTSLGNEPEVFGTDDLRMIQPLGKLPAATIDGKPLFESTAIVAAIADLVPEKNLIAKPGSWERHLHDQWAFFVTTELEMWAWAGMLNTHDFLMPKDRQVPQAIDQMHGLFKRGAGALEAAFDKTDYILGNRFSVTDIVVSYAVNLGSGIGFLGDEFPKLHAYLERMYQREHCTLARPRSASATTATE